MAGRRAGSQAGWGGKVHNKGKTFRDLLLQLQEKADKVVGKGIYTDICSLSEVLHSRYALSGAYGGENTLSLSF